MRRVIIKQIPRLSTVGAMLTIVACLAVHSAIAQDRPLPARPLTFVEKFTLINQTLFGNAELQEKEWVYALRAQDVASLRRQSKADSIDTIIGRESITKSSGNVRIILLKKDRRSRASSFTAEVYTQGVTESEGYKVFLKNVINNNELWDCADKNGYIGFLPTGHNELRKLKQALGELVPSQLNQKNKIELQAFVVEGKFSGGLPPDETAAD